MKKLKTWGPVIGSAVLIASIVLRLLGHGEAAAAIDTVAAALGFSNPASLDPVATATVVAQIAAAAVAGWGIVRKILSAIRQAREADSTVSPRP